MEAEEVMVVTEAVASEVVEVSVAETVAATVEVAVDSEVATRWEEGLLSYYFWHPYGLFAAVVWQYDQKRA